MEKELKLQLVGQVGVDPTMPVAAVLQTAPFADSVLTHIKLEEHTKTSGGFTLSIRPEIALCRYSPTHVLFLHPIGVFFVTHVCVMELLARFELATSSLPRMRSTN